MTTYHRFRVWDDEGSITVRARTATEALNMAARSMSPRGPLRCEIDERPPATS